jgi:antitoxin VapB
MATARLFESDGGQAVRLPEEFRFRCEEVEIFRRGKDVVLREKQPTLARAFDLITLLPSEIDERNDTPPQVRSDP